MRILLAHNFYQLAGGEDEVFRTEYELLKSYGHDVRQFTVHNDACDDMTRFQLLRATIWNKKMAAELREVIRRDRIELVHFHNTFPLISPAGYSAAHAEGAAVVQTLHNFRLICANALFFREGKPCEDCAGKLVPWPAVVHKCYRGNLMATGVVAATLTIHRLRNTWARDVDALIATTHFARDKFVHNGLPAEKITVKPNFLHPNPDLGPGDGNYAIFVARLTDEKGTRPVLEAWEKYNIPIPLKIIGDGPLAEQVKASIGRGTNIEWLGRRPLHEVYEHIGRATMLIFPSECYETFGRVAIEAFAKGTPVIASNHGAPADVVDQNRTGLLFKPGDAADLALNVHALLNDPQKLAKMRIEARREFEAKYTSERAYQQLMEIYNRAIASRKTMPQPMLTPQVTS
ncbi:MAG TPA: glycosyltransferase family 4 protein [Tepidisphaeraceae bacterium]|jgi:glycosyltransferase involved in cell wall biosynthesis